MVGVMKAGKLRKKAWVSRSLRLLGRFMADSDRYVRDSLGPFAIGDGFIRYAPRETLHFLSSYRDSEDTVVRWNVIAAFSTDSGVRRVSDAVGILPNLLNDNDPGLWTEKRRLVRRALGLPPRERQRALRALLQLGLSRTQLAEIRRAISEGGGS